MSVYDCELDDKNCLPDELLIVIFEKFDVDCWGRFARVCKRWRQIVDKDMLWIKAIANTKWKGISRRYIEDVNREWNGGKKQLYFHIRTEFIEINKDKVLAKYKNRNTYRTKKGLIPLRTFNSKGELTKVEFISKIHLYGFIGYVIPMLAAWWGLKIGFLFTLLGCGIRYYTYCSYKDAKQIIKNNEPYQATLNCLLWGVGSTCFIQTLVHIVHAARTTDWSKVDFSNDDKPSWTDDDDDRGISLPSLGFVRIGHVVLPSLWR